MLTHHGKFANYNRKQLNENGKRALTQDALPFNDKSVRIDLETELLLGFD